MPMFEDSGVSLPNNIKTPLDQINYDIDQFDGWNIDAKKRLIAQRIKLMSEAQLDNEPNSEPKAVTMQELADEVVSRLMLFARSKSNSVRDRTAALEASWRVYADFVRLSNHE